MKIEFAALEQASEHSLRYQLKLARQDFCLFGFLLESAEGLGIHSYNPKTLGMEVIVAQDQKDEFESLLDFLRAEPRID